MLESLISSKTRLKLVLKFFLNRSTQSYLRNLATEFGESTNSIRLELNRLEKAGLLKSSSLGNKKIFMANESHPLFNDLHNITMKWIGIDKIVEYLVSQIGNLKKAYITGDLAVGHDSKIIDILMIGRDLNQSLIIELINKAELLIKRKIRYIILQPEEAEEYLNKQASLLIWEEEEPAFVKTTADESE